jgi:hypothetical protein
VELLGGPRQRAVLALLVEANRAVSMDLLAEVICGGHPPDVWTTLQTYVFHLRQALELDRGPPRRRRRARASGGGPGGGSCVGRQILLCRCCDRPCPDAARPLEEVNDAVLVARGHSSRPAAVWPTPPVLPAG